MRKIIIIPFCILFLLLGSIYTTYATHIVGGEISYKCLGNDLYQIRLDLYQDCLNGDAVAISQDNPAFIGIYYQNGALYKIDTNFFKTASILVPANFKNECINNPPNICLRKTSFVKNIQLPPSSVGYTIVYQRCCRNNNIVNLLNPGNTGATYSANIPPTICNNSAVFKNFPPQIICVNNPLVYDHSATDDDGDSLSYELCSAYSGGSSSDAKPNPSFYAPPVNYRNPFSYNNPMGGTPPLQINPVTGIINSFPNFTGRFVVTVCCHEWRNGAIINTVKRDFQFEITNCSKAVVANIPQYSEEFNTYIVNCTDHTVFFENKSSGGFTYDWDFGDPTTTSDVSTDFQPSYTYPDTGTYVVKLVVNKGSTCPDSIVRFVKVFPDFKADFTYQGLPCPNETIQFTDASSSTFLPINNWTWIFDDNVHKTGVQTQNSFPEGGKYNVTLISKNYLGCVDTVTKAIEIDDFRPFAGNDTIIVKDELINFDAKGGDAYQWSPPDFLSNAFIPNPVGFYNQLGEFHYRVDISSEAGCTGFDSINVLVVNQASNLIPSAFTPNADGKNDNLKVIGIGYREVKYFRVFNRFGQKVYEGNDFKTGWDGTFKGVPVELGTYFYSALIVDRFGEEILLKGDVTLIR